VKQRSPVVLAPSFPAILVEAINWCATITYLLSHTKISEEQSLWYIRTQGKSTQML
jgi:hypothetical protein